MKRWEHGDVIVRREHLGLQPAQVIAAQPSQGIRFGLPVFVVEDTAERLVTYIAPGAEFGFPVGRWPTDDRLHPWHGRTAWQGEGCLMVQRPGDHHAIWHFWRESRELIAWYVNLQTDFVRTEHGYDTQDLELDVVVSPDGSFELKDDDVMDQRVDDGRFTPELVAWVRGYGADFIARLEHEGVFWEQEWAGWTPPAEWRNPRLPPGWATS